MKRRLSSLGLVGVIVALAVSFSGCASKAERVAKLKASAQQYVALERYNEAIIQYRNALKLDPQSGELEYELAEAYSKNEQYQSAYDALTKALNIDPNMQKAQQAMGQFYLVAKQFAKATATANAILAKHPGDPEATILLANIDAVQNKTDAGIQRLQALLRVHDDSVAAHLSLGILSAASKNAAQARQQFERAVQLDPHSVAAYNDLASLDESQGDWSSAEAELRNDVRLNADSIPAHQALADFLSGRQRYAEAEPIYKTLVEMNHGSAQSQFTLASFYLAQGKTANAVALDKVIAHQFPTYLKASEQWAAIAANQHDYAQANQVLDTVLKASPNDEPALLLRASIQLAQKQAADALKTLATAQQVDPNNAQTAYEQGQAYQQQNDLDRAQDSYLQAAKLNPNLYGAQSALAELMLNAGHSDAALVYAQKMQALAPNQPQGYLLAGSALANLKQYAQAEANLKHFAVLAPASSLGPSRLGYLYLMQARTADANREFEQALHLDPGDTDALAGLLSLYQQQGQLAKAAPRIEAQMTAARAAHVPAATIANMENQLARTYSQLKQPAQAEATLQKSLQVDPNNFNTYALLGALYAQQNSFRQAQAAFTQAVAKNPASPGMWTLLGILDEQLQQPAQGEQAYLKALALDPNNGVANNNLASMYADRANDLDQALVLAQRAKRALPTIPSVNDTLGWIYVKQGVYQLAIPLLQQAVAAQPKASDFRYHLGAALYGAGRKPEARVQLDQAVRLDQGLARQSDVQQMLKN